MSNPTEKYQKFKDLWDSATFEERQQFLQALPKDESKLFDFVLNLGFGEFFTINSSNLAEALVDPIGLICRKYNIAKARFVAWRQYMDDRQRCTGLTLKGEQCRKGGETYPKLTEFVPNVSDRCHQHVDLSERS